MFDKSEFLREVSELQKGEATTTHVALSDDIQVVYEVWRDQGGFLQASVYEAADFTEDTGNGWSSAETLVDLIESDIVDRQIETATDRLDDAIEMMGS